MFQVKEGDLLIQSYKIIGFVKEKRLSENLLIFFRALSIIDNDAFSGNQNNQVNQADQNNQVNQADQVDQVNQADQVDQTDLEALDQERDDQLSRNQVATASSSTNEGTGPRRRKGRFSKYFCFRQN